MDATHARVDDRMRNADWYDRATSRTEFLSRDLADTYLPKYLMATAKDTVALGIGAVTAVTIDASAAYGELFAVVLWFWLGDMLFGTLYALRNRNFRWTKAGDGILRLLVILTLPGITYMAASAPAGMLGIESGPPMQVVSLVLGIMGGHELLSLIDNASKLHPAVERVRGLVVKWIPTGSEPHPDTRPAEALIFLQDDPEDEPRRRNTPHGGPS